MTKMSKMQKVQHAKEFNANDSSRFCRPMILITINFFFEKNVSFKHKSTQTEFVCAVHVYSLTGMFYYFRLQN